MATTLCQSRCHCPVCRQRPLLRLPLSAHGFRRPPVCISPVGRTGAALAVLISGAEDLDAVGPVSANACWVAECDRESDIRQFGQRARARGRGCLVQDRRILRVNELGSSLFLRGASGAARTLDHVTVFPDGPISLHNTAIAGGNLHAYPSTTGTIRLCAMRRSCSYGHCVCGKRARQSMSSRPSGCY